MHECIIDLLSGCNPAYFPFLIESPEKCTIVPLGFKTFPPNKRSKVKFSHNYCFQPYRNKQHLPSDKQAAERPAV